MMPDVKHTHKSRNGCLQLIRWGRVAQDNTWKMWQSLLFVPVRLNKTPFCLHEEFIIFKSLNIQFEMKCHISTTKNPYVCLTQAHESFYTLTAEPLEMFFFAFSLHWIFCERCFLTETFHPFFFIFILLICLLLRLLLHRPILFLFFFPYYNSILLIENTCSLNIFPLYNHSLCHSDAIISVNGLFPVQFESFKPLRTQTFRLNSTHFRFNWQVKIALLLKSPPISIEMWYRWAAHTLKWTFTHLTTPSSKV